MSATTDKAVQKKEIEIYQLSPAGRKVFWVSWEKMMRGCGLSNESQAMVSSKIGRYSNTTALGEIEDAWAPAGRELARFAIEHLKRNDLVIPYKGIKEN